MAKEFDVYETICKDRFKTLEDKTDDLMVVVKNGLSHRIKRIDRLMWLLLTLFLAKLVSEFFM